MLNLTLNEYLKYADSVERGFINAAKLLMENNIYYASDLPYTTQLIPLAAIFAATNNHQISLVQKEKIMKWYWCGVLGELYGGGNETRFALDLPQVIDYAFNNGAEPRTIIDASFNPARLLTLRTRNSAAYKGIYALLLNDGARDFITGSPIDINTFLSESIDIHHIFPKAWCIQNNIPKEKYDCIVNKTPLSSRTNQIIGGKAPSQYLRKIQETNNISQEQISEILKTHVINPDALYSDDFDLFFSIRKTELLKRIEKAIGKEILKEVEWNDD